MTTIMQPFQCDRQPQIQETQRTTHTGTATRCRTQRRNPLRSERPQPHPPHTGGTFHRRLQPLYTEKCKVSFSGFLPNTSPMQHSIQPLPCVLQHHVANLHPSTHMATPDDNNHAAIPIRSATTGSRNAKNYAHRNSHSLQNTEEEPITLGTTPAAPAAHRRYLSSPSATTLHGKTHGFMLRLPSLITTSLRHHFPSLPLPFVTSHVIACSCFAMYYDVMYSFTPPFIECIVT